jgi:hypothetical protein
MGEWSNLKLSAAGTERTRTQVRAEPAAGFSTVGADLSSRIYQKRSAGVRTGLSVCGVNAATANIPNPHHRAEKAPPQQSR